jgi:hypothetical protein
MERANVNELLLLLIKCLECFETLLWKSPRTTELRFHRGFYLRRKRGRIWKCYFAGNHVNLVAKQAKRSCQQACCSFWNNQTLFNQQIVHLCFFGAAIPI